MPRKTRSQRVVPAVRTWEEVAKEQSKEALTPFRYPTDTDRELGQLAVIKAALSGVTEGGFYDYGEALSTAKIAQRSLASSQIVPHSKAYGGGKL